MTLVMVVKVILLRVGHLRGNKTTPAIRDLLNRQILTGLRGITLIQMKGQLCPVGVEAKRFATKLT